MVQEAQRRPNEVLKYWSWRVLDIISCLFAGLLVFFGAFFLVGSIVQHEWLLAVVATGCLVGFCNLAFLCIRDTLSRFKEK